MSRENEVLRANVNPDVLTSLLGNRSILGGIPPDPSAHPALPPPNQHETTLLLLPRGEMIEMYSVTLFLIHAERNDKANV